MKNAPRKKVLFLITKSNWGGAQRYVFDLVTNLDRDAFEPVVALGGDGELHQKLTAAGIRTLTLKSATRDVSIFKDIGFAHELWSILRSEQPGILHVNSSKAGGLGCLLGRLAFGPRVIFTAHGWAFNEQRPWWQKLIIKKLHWWTVLLSHTTIAVSNAIVEQMNWPYAQRKMVVINPGRTIPSFESRLTARTKLAHAHPPLASYITDVWLCSVAELHPIKQHHMLIDVMQTIVAEYPHIRLLCIGDGQLASELQAHITKLRLSKNIFLVGAIHEAATLLKAADAFILPSLSESYGYVLHEAGLARVPIIASLVGGITDIISSEKEGVLFDPTDSDALTSAIHNFIRQPHTFNEKTQALHSKLLSRTVAHMTTKTVDIYNQT